MLNQDQINFYQEHGYLRIPAVFKISLRGEFTPFDMARDPLYAA